jgi:hypothetical protein
MTLIGSIVYGLFKYSRIGIKQLNSKLENLIVKIKVQERMKRIERKKTISATFEKKEK